MRIPLYFIALLFVFSGSLYAANQENPPNILIVVADDLAYTDILEVEKEVEEFQIAQTQEGAHIKLVCNGEPNIGEIKDTILNNLHKYGLANPIVTFEVVDSLPHHPETGKIKRFIPLNKYF